MRQHLKKVIFPGARLRVDGPQAKQQRAEEIIHSLAARNPLLRISASRQERALVIWIDSIKDFWKRKENRTAKRFRITLKTPGLPQALRSHRR